MVDHEQAGEQDQQLPIDKTQHMPGVELSTGKQHCRTAQRERGTGPWCDDECYEQQRGHGHALGRLPWLPRGRSLGDVGCFVAASNSVWAHPPNAVLSDDNDPHHCEAGDNRQRGQERVAPERQLQALADQDVLRIADQGPCGADIRGAGQRQQKRHRIDPAPVAGLNQHRRGREAHDIVREHR